MKQELIWLKLCLGNDSYPEDSEFHDDEENDDNNNYNDQDNQEEEEHKVDEDNEDNNIETNELINQIHNTFNIEHKEQKEDLNSQKAYLIREFGLVDYVPEKQTSLSPIPTTTLNTSNDNSNLFSNINSQTNSQNNNNNNNIEPIEYPVGIIPTTSLMLQFDQVLTQRLIGYHLKWLKKRIAYLESLYKRR